MKAVLILFAPALVMAEGSTVSSVDPRAVCEDASRVLKDMRYTEFGQYAERGDFSHPNVAARLDSCVEGASLAAPFGSDVTYAVVAVMYNEANFRPGVVGKAGELGRMQVQAKLHCKPYSDLDDGKGGCTNPLRAGVRLMRLLVTKHGLEKALKLYNGSQRYADKVMGFIEAIKRSHERQRNRLAKR